jgi:sugar phosphate isomerase/epimerase
MYVALNPTLTAGGQLAWPEFARLAARVGYRGTDVMLQPAMDAGVQSTRALLADLGLKPAVINLPVDFRKDQAAFKEGYDKLADAAGFATAIGCPKMATWMLPSSPTPKEDLRKTYLDRLSACANVLAGHNVKLALEFVTPVHLRKLHPYEFIWRMDEMVALAKDCGPNCGVMLDSWHWHHAGATAADIVSAGKQRIVHVQVADAPKVPPEQIRDNERLFPGEGVIDFKAFFGALKKIGYEDGVSPEVFGHGLKDMPPEEGARLGLKHTRAVMLSAGV